MPGSTLPKYPSPSISFMREVWEGLVLMCEVGMGRECEWEGEEEYMNVRLFEEVW